MKRALYFLPAAIYYALIFFLSSRSYEIDIDAPHLDKAVHCLEFAVLAFLLSFGFFKGLKSSFRGKVVLTVSIGVLLGLLDETHQYFVPLRQFEVLDLAFDSLGILLGLLAFLFISRRLNV